jgi:HEAT repeat protein
MRPGLWVALAVVVLRPHLVRAADDPCLAFSRGGATRRDACIDSLIVDLADPELQNATRNRLAGFGTRAIPKLLAASRSSSDTLREGAADTLGRIGGKATDAPDAEAWEPVACRLVEMLADGTPEVRLEAIGALGSVGRDACGARAAIAALEGSDDPLQDMLVRAALRRLR